MIFVDALETVRRLFDDGFDYRSMDGFNVHMMYQST